MGLNFAKGPVYVVLKQTWFINQVNKALDKYNKFKRRRLTALWKDFGKMLLKVSVVLKVVSDPIVWLTL